MSQENQGPKVPSFVRGATRSTPMARIRPLSIWWGLVVVLCLCTGCIGGVIGSCLTIGVIANRWLDRMQGEIPSQTTVSTPPTTTDGAQTEPFDPIGPIPKDLLNSAPACKESDEVTTTEIVDPDPGELPDLPDDEYLCDSVEIVILPIGGNVWQLAEEVDKDKDSRVDWGALLRTYPDEVAKTLHAGAIIAIPMKGKHGPMATKIAYGDCP